ncbi:MAG: hypothetical protein QNJ69_00115 [Gammaproteobacteria bacterium]|nr:hypothetical protein [Gammaproteobacteria bacterium]
MIRAYSQRMLPPFSGFVQIAETERARAQSFDGVSWEIQYYAGTDQANREHKRPQGYAVDKGYFKIAHLHNQQLKPYVLPSCLDATEVAECITELSDYLATAQLPFPAADIYEYWLLDGADGSPLALIFSCCEESQKLTYPVHTEWTALPHSKIKIDNTAGEQARNEPPVNHRFQHLVARRAGNKPRAAWFKRDDKDANTFPCFMVREDWQQEADNDLCQRYLLRNAPRLLMLQGLNRDDRERLEIAAKDYAIEVDDYFPMYPEIIDQRRMAAIRVEARLRKASPHQHKVKSSKTSKDKAPLSKDMRIIEN